MQNAYRDRVLAGTASAGLLLLQHPPTITLGSLTEAADLLVSRERLFERGVRVYETNRGGRATYHGPGQLVGYPVLDLARLPRGTTSCPSLRGYLRSLEEAMIRLLSSLGIGADRIDGAAGVWVDGRKIVSVGVAVRRSVTTHGFALNVNPDLSAFHAIRPCGFDPGVMTSIERETGAVPDWRMLEETVAGFLSETLGFDACEFMTSADAAPPPTRC